MNRLRTYGKVMPLLPLTRRHLTAWCLGIRDGWNQPHHLSSSSNVDHLALPDAEEKRGEDWAVQEALDRGINLGQWLRSPLNHQQQEES